MDWLSTGMQILLAGLTIWKDERAGEFKRRVIELKTIIMEERIKPVYTKGMQSGTFRNDVIIGHAERELLILSNAFTSSVV